MHNSLFRDICPYLGTMAYNSALLYNVLNLLKSDWWLKMLEVVKLKGGFHFKGSFHTKNIWLSTLEDFENISKNFGGIYSQETTSKGVLHKLYVPDLNILFLYLER